MSAALLTVSEVADRLASRPEGSPDGESPRPSWPVEIATDGQPVWGSRRSGVRAARSGRGRLAALCGHYCCLYVYWILVKVSDRVSVGVLVVPVSE